MLTGQRSVTLVVKPKIALNHFNAAMMATALACHVGRGPNLNDRWSSQ